MKKKVALCLFGLTGNMTQGGKGAALAPHIAHSYYQKHIFAHNDVDVFIHTWSVEQEKTLRELYQPVKAIFEPQIQFSGKPLLRKQLSRLPLFWKELLLIQLRNNWLALPKSLTQLADRVYSRWYASQKVLNLKKVHEEEKNFVYDYVMISRFDISFFTDIHFQDYDPNYFYASHRNIGANHNHDLSWTVNLRPYDDAFMDLWFFSNSDYMNKFARLYDQITQYSLHPCFAAKQHVYSFTDQVKRLFHYGKEYDLVRSHFFR